MSAPRAMFYVQHLLGLGHLARATRIGNALADAGVDTVMVMGGVEPPGWPAGRTRLARLDPVRVEADDMATLLAADGAPFDAARKAARRDALLTLFAAEQPDMLIIEAFPFGRRQMRFEIVPLLDAARANHSCVIVSSIRDILQEKPRPERAIETCEMVERYFDAVLVHGEASTPLSLTFPLAERIADRLTYTGLVGPPPPAEAAGSHDVVVSGGGGAVAEGMLAAAIAALRDPRLVSLSALVLTGPNLPLDARERLTATARDGVEVAGRVHDLPARLLRARLSVSQAGYNTAADLTATGCPAVLVPFAAGGETEQTRRALAMEQNGTAVMLPEAEATPEAMTDAMLRALKLPRRPPGRLDGAERSARALLALLDARQAGSPSSASQNASIL